MRHPIGIGAMRNENHKTQENRKALDYCLRAYFSGDLDPSNRVNRRSEGSDTRIGLPLADKLVTRLELGLALERLQQARPDLYVLVYEVFARRRARFEIAQTYHIGRETIRKALDTALDLMIDGIWRDDLAA